MATVTTSHHSDKNSLRTPRRGWCVPRDVRRFGERLMGQQFWCWGQDVKYQGGNLLIRYGLERHRDQSPQDRSSCYRFDNDKTHVALWGFGMFFGQRRLGGLYLGRFDFHPKWAPIESLSLSIHWPDDLPDFSRPRGNAQWLVARKIFRATQKWIADYETWVIAEAGREYREACIAQWLRPHVRAEKVAPAWKYLSRRGWEKPGERNSANLDRYTIGVKHK